MMSTAPVPPSVLEAVDGMLVILLSIMLLFAVVHIFDVWKEVRSVFQGRGGVFRSLRAMYFDRKPSVAICVFIFALMLRFGSFWYYLHLQNHGMAPDAVARHTTEIFVLATLLLITAIVCWIRNTSPVAISNWQWAIVVVSASAASVLLAL